MSTHYRNPFSSNSQRGPYAKVESKNQSRQAARVSQKALSLFAQKALRHAAPAFISKALDAATFANLKALIGAASVAHTAASSDNDQPPDSEMDREVLHGSEAHDSRHDLGDMTHHDQ